MDRPQAAQEEPMTADALLLTPEQAAKRLNVARSFLYGHLLMTGALASVKIGSKCRRIPARSLEEYVARLIAEQGWGAPPASAAWWGGVLSGSERGMAEVEMRLAARAW